MIDLYTEKFAKPGLKLFGKATEVLKAVKGDRYTAFAQIIDFTWFEIWHHEGRRARHGASMQGPDYTHWHGTYEVAKHWYGKYIPEIRDIIELGKTSNARKLAEELEAMLEEVLNDPNHRWSIGKEDPAVKAERLRRQKEFNKRYKK